jgi:hypothetical protein
MKDHNRRCFVAFQLPNYVDFSPSHTNKHSASQKIFCLLWNLEVHYVGKSPPFDCMLRPINLVDSVTAYFLKTHPNITLSFTLKSQFIASLQVSRSKFCNNLYLPLCNPAQLHVILLDDKDYWCPSVSNFLNFPVSSSFSGPNIL